MDRMQARESEIRSLYLTYASVVHNRCLRILTSEEEAWDATQEVFIKLMQSYGAIREKKAVLAWLLRVSTNLCISVLRKRREVSFDEEYHVSQKGNENQEHHILSRQIMHSLLRSWDTKTVEIVLYTYIDGYTQAEIAHLMNIGESTIRKYLTRFRRTIQHQKWNE